MRSRDHRSKDQLDRLIHRALVDSVADEEPPARVWERIRASLTKPEGQPTIHWSGLALQAAMLLVLFVFGGTMARQGRLIGRDAATPTRSSLTATVSSYVDHWPASPRTARIASLALYGNSAPEMHARGTEIVMDPEEIAFMQK